MINPANRGLRVQVFKKLDPDNQHQLIGYDYLNDERGIELHAILKDREFFPKITRDYKFVVPEDRL